MSIFCKEHPNLLRSEILDRVRFVGKMTGCQSRLLLSKLHPWHRQVAETLPQILSPHDVSRSQSNRVAYQSFSPCAGRNQITVELPHKIQ